MKPTENKFPHSLQSSVALLCVTPSVTIANPLLQEAVGEGKKKNCHVFLSLKIKEW